MTNVDEGQTRDVVRACLKSQDEVRLMDAMRYFHVFQAKMTFTTDGLQVVLGDGREIQVQLEGTELLEWGVIYAARQLASPDN